MNVYRLKHELDGYRPMEYQGDDFAAWQRLEEAQPLADSWVPQVIRHLTKAEARLAGEDTDADTLDSDVPWVLGATRYTVLSERAVQAGRSFWTEFGELLPLACDAGRYWVFHCLVRVEGALDLERCDKMVLRSSGQIAKIERYAFRSEPLTNRVMFGLTEAEQDYVFVTDAGRERIEALNLRGVVLERVWTSES